LTLAGYGGTIAPLYNYVRRGAPSAGLRVRRRPRAAWRGMRQFSTGGTYVNFLTEEEGGERIREAYGENDDRLVEVKSRWNPHNLFRMNKNVAPRTHRAELGRATHYRR